MNEEVKSIIRKFRENPQKPLTAVEKISGTPLTIFPQIPPTDLLPTPKNPGKPTPKLGGE